MMTHSSLFVGRGRSNWRSSAEVEPQQQPAAPIESYNQPEIDNYYSQGAPIAPPAMDIVGEVSDSYVLQWRI